MEPKKRNVVMDSLFVTYQNVAHKIDSPVLAIGAERLAAIRECDRRARAWDELRKWADPHSELYAKMNSLIPPEPVDKLERLTSWLRDIGACESPDEIVRASALFKKIKELQNEDR